MRASVALTSMTLFPIQREVGRSVDRAAPSQGVEVLKFRFYLGPMMALCAVLLASCGGKSSSSATASVRLVNATNTHSSLVLLANAAIVGAATAVDSVSEYLGVTAGSPTLQVNDGVTSAALATLSPSVGGGAHYILVAYENGGIVRTTVIAEDVAVPAAGTASLRAFNAATDAGAIDVYVTDPAANIATLTSPTFSFGTSTVLQTSGFLSITPGTYRVRVTGAGNTSDLRLDIPSVTLTSAGVASLLLTPTSGGTLVNGAFLAQQSTYTAARNKNARVRLAAAVAGGAAVTASSGTTPIGAAVVSPSVGAYTLVPAGGPLNISVNGGSVGAPAAVPTAGSDTTLLVYGPAATATASLITDDNHLPTVATNLKLRLINGITGAAAPPLTLNAAFAVLASNVQPGTASVYGIVGASTALRLDVFSPASLTPIYSESNLSVPGNAVYTLFMLGDAGAPIHLLQRDR